MPLDQYQVDAFSGHAFAGNPAAVIVTEQPLAESLMRNIAAENNLSETAFVCRQEQDWAIRWFTPSTEVDLCGHASLAAAWVLATEYELLAAGRESVNIRFFSRSGWLPITVNADSVTLDFPAQTLAPVTLPQQIAEGLGISAENLPCFKAQLSNGNYLLELPTAAAVKALVPDMAKLAELKDGGIIVTAASTDVDFVSRFFAPAFGIDEDPVTGSAHCALAPYWAEKLNRSKLRARQVSQRGGDLGCELRADRVLISGQAVTVKQSIWRLE